MSENGGAVGPKLDGWPETGGVTKTGGVPNDWVPDNGGVSENGGVRFGLLKVVAVGPKLDGSRGNPSSPENSGVRFGLLKVVAWLKIEDNGVLGVDWPGNGALGVDWPKIEDNGAVGGCLRSNCVSKCSSAMSTRELLS